MSTAARAAEPRFLTVKQAAAVTGLGVDTLWRHIHAGRLKAKLTNRQGGKALVRVTDLDAWFDGLEDA